MQSVARAVPWVGLGAALAVLPALTNDYTQYVVSLSLVYVLVAVGFNIILGYAGQLAFANAAFFGIGAYTVGLLRVQLGVPVWAGLPAAGLVAAVSGALVGFPALRLRGYYLAIVTVAFSELMRWVYVHGGAWTFGPSGFSVPDPVLFGWVLASEKAKYYLILPVVLLLLGATRNLLRSRFGRAFAAIRDSEVVAVSLAVDLAHAKLLAFTVSAFLVGVAGGLFAVLLGRVTPDSFGMGELLLHFVIVMLGGLGSLLGSVLGALVLTSLPELLRNFQAWQEILFSLLLILGIVFMPRGIAGLLASRWARLGERLY